MGFHFWISAFKIFFDVDDKHSEPIIGMES